MEEREYKEGCVFNNPEKLKKCLMCKLFEKLSDCPYNSSTDVICPLDSKQ